MTIRASDNLQFILTSHLQYIMHPFRDQTKPEHSSLLRTLKDRWSIVTTEDSKDLDGVMFMSRMLCDIKITCFGCQHACEVVLM